jgi:hypothetical protein
VSALGKNETGLVMLDQRLAQRYPINGLKIKL